MIKEFFCGIWRDRHVLFGLVRVDLQRKYRRSKLGVAWTMLTPLGLVLIIGSVYSIIWGADPRSFIPLLFAGLNPWLFLNGSIDQSTMSFINAEGYLKQTTVNAQIFPLRTVLVNFINLLYSILAFFGAYLLLNPALFSAKMLMTIPGLFLMFLFTTGFSYIAAVINLNIRDYQPLQALILQALFYATPVIYPPEMLAEKGFAFIYQINPFYYMIEVVRTPMQGVSLPSLQTYCIAILFALGSFGLGLYVMMKQKKGIAFKL